MEYVELKDVEEDVEHDIDLSFLIQISVETLAEAYEEMK